MAGNGHLQVRPYRPEDAPLLGDIFYRAVREVACRSYSRDQVEAWAIFPPPAEFYERKAADGRCLLLATDRDDRPVAYGDVERSGHIDHLFCLPEAIGTGAASRLYDQLEVQARAWNLKRLFVEASEFAQPFFDHKGFVNLGRKHFIMRGAQMHNYDMEKFL